MGKSSFELVTGSYEEFLLGYKYSSKERELVQSFAAHDHVASVRCVALSGQYLASGGADDRIFIYDLKSRKEHCSLTHHEATINCLQFTDNHTHLLSGSADGVLAIVRVGNWQVEKIWEKAHKGAAILDIAVHSSGKLALTLGADSHLCTWNLVKGRQAYIINLRSKCKDTRSLEKILWASDGVRFVLYGGKYTEVWSIESGGALKQIEHQEKVTSCVWLDDSLLLVGHEDGQITLLDIEDIENKKTFKAHESRIKSMAVYRKWRISICSNGDIKIWDKDFEELAKIESGCRLTCLCVVPPIKVKEEESTNNEENVAEKVTETKKKITKAQLIEEVEESEDDTIIEENPNKKRNSKGILIIEKESKKKKRKKSRID